MNAKFAPPGIVTICNSSERGTALSARCCRGLHTISHATVHRGGWALLKPGGDFRQSPGSVIRSTNSLIPSRNCLQERVCSLRSGSRMKTGDEQL